jgi:galactokinase
MSPSATDKPAATPVPAHLTDAFTKLFGAAPTLAASAPGRVNLIGEHTDYNDGFVLPMAIGRRTYALARPIPGTLITLASTNQPDTATFTADASLAPTTPKWANYVKGVFAGFVTRGLLKPTGLQILISSDVPLGGGLSSSASLEVATATLIEQLLSQSLSGPDKALLCQKAEHTFAFMPCGIMDQFISTMGQEGHAMLLDCRSLQATQVPLNDPNLAVLIANSNVKHELTGSEYPERRDACHQAAKLLGVKALRDLTPDQLLAGKSKLSDLQFKRARHVVTEIARTTAASAAAAKHDWATFGNLMVQSHVSMRDDFEISTPEIDKLVDIALSLQSQNLVYGSRLTGGGFGGCTVSLIRADKADQISSHISSQYKKATNLQATLFISRPAQGARPEAV